MCEKVMISQKDKQLIESVYPAELPKNYIPAYEELVKENVLKNKTERFSTDIEEIWSGRKDKYFFSIPRDVFDVRQEFVKIFC